MNLRLLLKQGRAFLINLREFLFMENLQKNCVISCI